VCTRDSQLAERVAQLRNIGKHANGEHVRLGYNERLHGMQAAFLRAKLPCLDAWNQARRMHARRYREALGHDGLELLGEREESPCVYHLFPVRHSERDALAQHLAEHRIQTGIHYSPATHRHPAFDSLPETSRPIELPNAESWAARELSLPMFAELTADEIEWIADACTSFTAATAPNLQEALA
jgi:dTDP-4-amino-4,6-dideoxygalactose transaminase